MQVINTEGAWKVNLRLGKQLGIQAIQSLITALNSLCDNKLGAI